MASICDYICIFYLWAHINTILVSWLRTLLGGEFIGTIAIFLFKQNHKVTHRTSRVSMNRSNLLMMQGK